MRKARDYQKVCVLWKSAEARLPNHSKRKVGDVRNPPVNRILDRLQARGERLSKVTYAHHSTSQECDVERSEREMVVKCVKRI